MRWIFMRPKLAHLVGKSLFFMGGLLVILGLIGRAALLALNQTRNLSKLPPLNGLSDAYPMYSLWWVPEGILGYAVALILAGLGLYLALAAKAILKAMTPSGRYAKGY